MRNTFLPFAPPLIGEEEIAEVVATLRSGWITTGPKTKQFEAEFERFVGAPGALALSSCTGALHVALAALGIGPGDAVVTTPMTFCSTVNVIEQVGARPILADVEPDTLNIDPARVEEVLGGEAPLLERWRSPAADFRVKALPARHEGRMVGTLGTLTAFSFYATKNLTTAEGGMLTGEPELLEQAAIWSLHGMDRDAWKRYSEAGSWYYEVVAPGFKYNMTDIQASLGVHQLRRLPEFHRRRRQIAQAYSRAFAEMEEVQAPVERGEVEHAWHLYVLRLNLEMLTIDRARFLQELAALNIGASVHFIPVHLHPYYRDKYRFRPEDFPVAYREYQRIVSLPLYPGMRDEDVQDVVEAVATVVKRHRR